MTNTPKRAASARAPRKLARTITCYHRALALATTLLTSPYLCAQALAEAPSKTRKELAPMIDAMANRNPEPETIGRRRLLAKPVFAENYNWDEDKRAGRAFVAVRRDDGEDLWEELLNHFDDKRYAGIVEVNGASLEKYNVGGLCMLLAYDRLSSAFEKFLPVNDIGHPIWPNYGVGGDLVQWRKERADKSLYELQIEVCEVAMKSLEAEGRKEGLPHDAVRESCAKIQERIEQLRREKRPFFRMLVIDSWHRYSEEEADRIRKGLKEKRLLKSRSAR